jgi:tRNA(adenine34) deaminase
MDQDPRFMRMALDLAEQARDLGEIPVGSIVAIDGEVVGSGRNSSIALADPTAHAEILALREAAARIGNYRLIGATVYCTVEPCLMCLGAMLHARIARLVYGVADPKVGAMGKLKALAEGGAEFNHGFEITSGLLAEKASALLHEFFKERR